jgi:hypothetical protein
MFNGQILDPRQNAEAQKWLAMVSHLEQTLRQGNDTALVDLALLYTQGALGSKPDPEKALDYYRLAALRGVPKASRALGQIYYEGRMGVKRNWSIAAEYYKQAAELKDAESLFQYGLLFLHGHGVRKQPAEAFLRFQAAAKLKHIEAIHYLGRCFLQGWGVDAVDGEKGLGLLQLAAQSGSLEAMILLGDLHYQESNTVVSRSFEKAAYWFRAALERQLGKLTAT